MDSKMLESVEPDVLQVIEFYCGIGGMRYALRRHNVQFRVVAAFDINSVTNAIYEHNFQERVNPADIRSLSAEVLDRYGANLWTISPPCQPYTRVGKQLQSKDGRANSFLSLLGELKKMRNPPQYIFVENVAGFEKSDSFDMMCDVFSSRGFSARHFLLTPYQCGIPNSRLRYYCIANSTLSDPSERARVISNVPPFPSAQSIVPLHTFLQPAAADNCPSFFVSKEVIHRWGRAVDIVRPSDVHSCCFTKTYSKYWTGTGSLLQTKEGESIAKDDLSGLENAGLRLFAPQEIAAIHGFPASFSFPQSTTETQKYRALGNSLSIDIVAELMRVLLS